jgi:TalC/MipB family fructose-6-phosphate aldolase
MIEFMIDTANLEAIARCVDLFPVAGVTSNPSILEIEGKIDFFPHLRKIREIIGPDRSLHVQVIAEDAPGIIKESETILKKLDDQVFIKIPSTEEGFKAMRHLRKRGVRITATEAYTQIQGLAAAACDADYIVLYYNRMKNMDIDADHSIRALRDVLDREKMGAKILAASFRSIRQTTDAISSGAHGVTVPDRLLRDAFDLPIVKAAGKVFHKAWVSIQGDISITEL